MGRTEPPARSHSQVVKYRRFVTTRARAQDNSNAVCYSRVFEGALKGGVYLFGFIFSPLILGWHAKKGWKPLVYSIPHSSPHSTADKVTELAQLFSHNDHFSNISCHFS